MAYQNNPNFTNFFKQHGLKFHAYADYKKADIAERSALYAELAKKIWAADLEVDQQEVQGMDSVVLVGVRGWA